MKYTQKIFLFTAVFTLLYSCSVRKDGFLNRNYHALTTKYNVLFNGQQAFDKGLEEIRNKHQDNFWKRLEIEPITFEENKIQAPKFTPKNPDGSINEEEANNNLTPFEKAEQKARKAIETHSMNINGRQRNRKIDDAYLLLGKGRYYTQRFIPALEAFNYVIAEYPEADLIEETRIWRAKTNIRLGNEKLAIESLKFLLDVQENEEPLPDEIKEQAHTALAMAYVESDSINKVVEQLKLATQTHENKTQTARNMFILGQIYSELGQKDSARYVFEELADFKKAPDKYRIHANIAQVKNTSADSSSVALIKKFKKLIRNRDNRPYLDELYYQVGVLEENQDSISAAVENYKKSLRAKNGSDYQKTYTYEKLGNIYFKDANFIKASSYYDSVLQVASENFKNEKRIRRVKRRHKALASLNKYENVLKVNDSILGLATMTKEEQTEYFTNYVEKLKQQDEEIAQQRLNAISFGNSFGGGGASIVNNNSGKWYFYNTQTKAFGEAEFQRVWGNRPLEDNWRWSDRTLINTISADSIASTTKSRYDVASYVKTIPTNKVALDSLTYQRNDALFQLGLIYKEQFKNPPLAIKNLERLQTVNTDKNLKLPIHYHLYQLHNAEGNTAKAATHKNVILTDYADTQFAQIIKYPNKKLKQEESVDETAEAYKEIYYLYKEDKYGEVISKVDAILPTIQGSVLIPKFELLKAFSVGKTKDKAAYKKAMEFVAFNYANTEEGKKAREIVKKLQ